MGSDKAKAWLIKRDQAEPLIGPAFGFVQGSSSMAYDNTEYPVLSQPTLQGTEVVRSGSIQYYPSTLSEEEIFIRRL